MSKSSGEFLRLQLLIDKGFHPLAYRMMCLQAHYRSELEFSWDNLAAALTRLKRMVMAVEGLKARAEHEDATYMIQTSLMNNPSALKQKLTANLHPKLQPLPEQFDAALSDDLMVPRALPLLEEALSMKKVPVDDKLRLAAAMDQALGLNLLTLTRADLRIRPKDAQISEEEIEAELDRRQAARAAKDFATSDAIRDALAARGVEVMDGDPLRWEWAISVD